MWTTRVSPCAGSSRPSGRAGGSSSTSLSRARRARPALSRGPLFRAAFGAVDLVRQVVSSLPQRLAGVATTIIAALVYLPLARSARNLDAVGRPTRRRTGTRSVASRVAPPNPGGRAQRVGVAGRAIRSQISRACAVCRAPGASRVAAGRSSTCGGENGTTRSTHPGVGDQQPCRLLEVRVVAGNSSSYVAPAVHVLTQAPRATHSLELGNAAHRSQRNHSVVLNAPVTLLTAATERRDRGSPNGATDGAGLPRCL